MNDNKFKLPDPEILYAYTDETPDILKRIIKKRRANFGKKVLITGSRQNYEIFLPRITKGLLNVFMSYSSIIVGDAKGVDAVIVRKCNEMGIPYTCYGISRMGRNPESYGNYKQVEGASNYGKGAYFYRDEVMVELSDVCVAFWNGFSKGTKHTYDYARKLGKPSLLILPEKSDYEPFANEKIEWV